MSGIRKMMYGSLSVPSAGGWITMDASLWTVGSDVTKVGNNLNTSPTSGGSTSFCKSTLKILDGGVGNIRFTGTSYLFGLNQDVDYSGNQNDVAYCIISENYSGGSGNQSAIKYGISQASLGNGTGVITIEIELTLTEAVWYYGDLRTEFARIVRTTIGAGIPLYVMADAGGGGFQNIQYKGDFTT